VSYLSVRSGRTEYEVAEVLWLWEGDYRAQYPVTWEQARVMGALKACRTAKLGGTVYQCSECGAMQIAYCSCRDRHCPKCGKFKKAEWLARQEVLLLPVPYFHVTFTTDHAINKLVGANRRVIYDALFWAVGESLREFGQKYLGGELGFTAVLHTWGQRLEPHVHVHCIVTGGALSQDGQRWQASQADFLFPAEEFSAAYRDRFCRKLKRLYRRGELKLVGQCADLDVLGTVVEMQAKAWAVFIKPFAGPEPVEEYLSRYVHQVAISNYRLVDIDRAKGAVSFTYHDNRAGGEERVETLRGVEFIRRFLWHVLPAHFVRLRHFGLHNSRARSQRLPQARALLGLEPAVPQAEPLSLRGWLIEVVGAEEIDRCPHCGREATLFKRGEFEGLNWLNLFLMGLIKLGLAGRVRRW
jgi:hypothetical protein